MKTNIKNTIAIHEAKMELLSSLPSEKMIYDDAIAYGLENKWAFDEDRFNSEEWYANEIKEEMETYNIKETKMKYEVELRTSLTVAYLDDGSQIFCGSDLEDNITNFSNLLIEKLGKDADLWFREILGDVYIDGVYDGEHMEERLDE